MPVPTNITPPEAPNDAPVDEAFVGDEATHTIGRYQATPSADPLPARLVAVGTQDRIVAS